MGRCVDEALDEALVKTVAAHVSQMDFSPSSSHPHMTPTSFLMDPPSTSSLAWGHPSSLPSFATLPYVGIPPNPSNPLETVLPRGLLYLIVDLFFDYIYPLTPCLHRPSFMRDLHAKREERPGEEDWTHMVLSLVSSTLSQLPRAFVAMPRRDVKLLVERCYRICRNFMSQDFVTVSIDRSEFPPF